MDSFRTGHLGLREFTAVLIIFTSGKIFFTFPQTLMAEAYTAAWLEVLLAWCFAMALVLPALWLLKRHPDDSLIGIAENLGGPIIGLISCVLIAIFFFTLTVLSIRQFTEMVITALLPTTPISVITLVFLISMLYACYQGMEALSRTAWLLSPFLLGTIILLVLALLPKANLYDLFPIAGPSPLKLLKLSSLHVTMFGELLLVFILHQTLRRPGDTWKSMFGGMLGSLLIILTIVTLYQLIFPLPAGIKGGAHPLYQLARLITYGRFLERVESIFIFVWVLSLLINASISLWATAYVLAKGLKLPMYQPLLFVLTALVYAAIFTIPDFPSAVRYAGLIQMYGFIPVIFLPYILLLISLLKKKGGSTSEKKLEKTPNPT